jgi:hypothetical protein
MRRSSDRTRFELQALRLYVHGPDGLNIRTVHTLARSPLWLEMRCLLRSAGFSEAETAALMNWEHPLGCACWKCVQGLHNAVRRRGK